MNKQNIKLKLYIVSDYISEIFMVVSVNYGTDGDSFHRPMSLEFEEKLGGVILE